MPRVLRAAPRHPRHNKQLHPPSRAGNKLQAGTRGHKLKPEIAPFAIVRSDLWDFKFRIFSGSYKSPRRKAEGGISLNIERDGGKDNFQKRLDHFLLYLTFLGNPSIDR
jgi:hypothetical protein